MMFRHGQPLDPVAPLVPIAMPRIGLGCAPLGDLFADTADDVAQATLDAAWQAGVRFFDTAPWYGHGLSEHRLGTMLRQAPRPAYYLTTKVGRVYAPAPRGADARAKWAGGLNFAVRYDYSAAGFAESLAQSRMRLAQSSIDGLIIHDLDRGHHGPDMERHFDDLMASGLDYLKGLKASGEIAAIGMGMNALADFAYFIDRVEVDFFIVAMPYTLLDQSSLHGPMARCAERGIGVVIGAPYASGILADPTDPAARYAYEPAGKEIQEKALALAACCARHGVTLPAAALQFPLLHPAVRAVIPGALSPEHVRQNVGHVAAPIPAALWEEMRDRGLIDPKVPLAA
jgi:D-threo-aldose 1-dehydrogenase